MVICHASRVTALIWMAEGAAATSAPMAHYISKLQPLNSCQSRRVVYGGVAPLDSIPKIQGVTSNQLLSLMDFPETTIVTGSRSTVPPQVSAKLAEAAYKGMNVVMIFLQFGSLVWITVQEASVPRMNTPSWSILVLESTVYSRIPLRAASRYYYNISASGTFLRRVSAFWNEALEPWIRWIHRIHSSEGIRSWSCTSKSWCLDCPRTTVGPLQSVSHHLTKEQVCSPQRCWNAPPACSRC